MDLTLEHPGDHTYVRSVSEEGIRIAEDLYTDPLILTPDSVITDWPVPGGRDISEAVLDSVLDLEPEILLIGTGKAQVFLAPELAMSIYRRETGFEVMTTDAACRTFNILVSEERKVVAALLPPGFNP
ncbi:MAG: hypothetical protein KJO33_00795 [Gammaproteobacteria bacterium]|nr:hypothetical protein [Gammaproteobacteria bacterium]NNK33076.1 hypothetical protein [Xanthomonadales bacterium]